MNKAVFMDHKDGELEPNLFERMKKNFAQVVFAMRTDPDIKTKVADADAFFVKISTKIDKEIIDAAPKLKYIEVCSTAFDAIDAVYARSKGITVCNLGGYSTEAVAEFFFAALLEKTREMEKAKIQARKEDYSFDKFMGLELTGKTLGVIGAGAIGGRIATIGLGFGMNVLYVSKTPKPKLDQMGAKKVTLEELAKTSDFISVNLKLNTETRGMVSKQIIDSFKKGCIVISLAPPALVDQEALLARKDITFIFDHSDDMDPALVKRFLEAEHCVVYPPVAFRSVEANFARWDTFAANIEKFIAGTPQNVVN